jgi:hypothetical protein
MAGAPVLVLKFVQGEGTANEIQIAELEPERFAATRPFAV